MCVYIIYIYIYIYIFVSPRGSTELVGPRKAQQFDRHYYP